MLKNTKRLIKIYEKLSIYRIKVLQQEIKCDILKLLININQIERRIIMFCKNCGAQMDAAAAVCVNCGAAKGTGTSFCQNCGQQVAPGAAVCLSCGVATAGSVGKSEKSKLVAGLLALFLGYLGIHNLYLGYTKKGITQLLIYLLLCWTIVAPLAIWVWTLVECIQIFTDKIPDAEGNPLS